MKALRIIALIICAYFLILGGGLFISKACEGEFHPVSLIMAIVAIALIVLIVVMWIKSSKKAAEEKADPGIIRRRFGEKYNNKVKAANAIFKALWVLIVLLVLSIAMIVFGYLMVWDILLNAGLVALIVLAVVGIVMAIVYAAKYEATKLNSRILKRWGISLDSCLEGIENESNPMIGPNKVICADNAMIFSRQALIVPYSCVYWVYRKNYSVNFVPLASNMVLRTVDGKTFETHISDADILWILNHFRSRFPNELIVGYGHEQAKKYRQIRKQYRKKG